ncbi:MAG: ABC transporter ATP-binding protein, partial [Candidatus Heimdallarchaeota archaeon]
ALFPHLTVIENIVFGLETRKWSKEEKTTRVKELLELVGLIDKGKRYPRELSGGEKSRVALARALAPHPTLLLLDEPLSALDMSLKDSLRDAIREIQQKVNISTIYVTHDQKEAMEISDRIIILDHGCIIESGSPQDLYLAPKKKFTASFLGISNILSGAVKENKNESFLETSFGLLKLPETKLPARKRLSIAIFPEHINLSTKKQNKANEFEGVIVRSSFGGAIVEVVVDVNGVELEVQITSIYLNQKYKKKDSVYISIPVSSILILED